MAEIKTKWDLTLLYQGNNDPRIERDLKRTEAAYQKFARAWSGREDYLTDEKVLAKALAAYEALAAKLTPEKPLLYFNYQKDLNTGDAAVQARLNLLMERYSQAQNQLVFFPVALARIKPADQRRFLKSTILSPYKYFLQVIFKQARHALSEKEERLLNLKGLPAHELWTRSTEKMLAKREIAWQGRKLPLAEANFKLASLPTPERRVLGGLINTELAAVADFAEAELNAIVLDKKINDELRGFSEPYAGTILGYQNEPETVRHLVDTVTKHFPLAHRFYRAKAKMMGLKTFHYADRAATIGQAKKKISWEQAVAIVRDAFGAFDPWYRETFDDFLRRGQIDAFPKKGKRGGAYCSSSDNSPTFVFLNHVPDFYSAVVMAHEMGHAFHATLSAKHQPPLYRGHTIATAEVASTFFENLVFDQVLPLLSPAEQIIALHDKLNGSVSTIFRQIACFNFELAMHRGIRERGQLTKVELAQLMNEHLGAYLGPLFKLTPEDGYAFVGWPHLRRFFYVYTYALGELVSSAFYLNYRENPNFKENLQRFLSAGGSASPEDIFAAAGVNIRDPRFFATGLQKIERDLARLEKLIK
jgi:oligoendopeptidase F